MLGKPNACSCGRVDAGNSYNLRVIAERIDKIEKALSRASKVFLGWRVRGRMGSGAEYKSPIYHSYSKAASIIEWDYFMVGSGKIFRVWGKPL